MGQFMTQVGLCMSIAPVYRIAHSFNTLNLGELSWFVAAYSLTVGSFILVAGQFGDVYGHKLMFIIGFVWFRLWSLLAGFSVWSGQVFFDCCRAFQGIGPAMLLPNALAILGRTYPPGMRRQWSLAFSGQLRQTGHCWGCLSVSAGPKALVAMGLLDHGHRLLSFGLPRHYSHSARVTTQVRRSPVALDPT